jgi:hypothetical protein
VLEIVAFADDIAVMKAWVSGIKAPESVARMLPGHPAATA